MFVMIQEQHQEQIKKKESNKQALKMAQKSITNAGVNDGKVQYFTGGKKG